jgi:RNA ligase (TIGR02306 family)
LLPTSVITQDIPFELGADVSELLGITKWEPTLSANLVGIAKGAFPAFIPKTDQERCQNLVSEIRTASYAQEMFEATEKLEGTSATFYVRDKQFGVCSRNLELEYDENNSLWVAAKEFDLENKLLALGKDIAVQGELVGPGIQKNIYGLKDVSFYVFDIYDIREGKYLRPKDRKELAEELCLPHVPVIGKFVLDDNIDTILAFADGTSALANTAREGVVFKSMNSNFNFKAISNKYLLKCKPDSTSA